jgi:protein farnesyltransferase/geranylgeranyltransferase type-1 subunit alpha
MSASSPTPYIPLSHRPEWQDTTPLPQNDPPAPSVVVPIAYPDEYRDATDYMRAVLATGERSRRVQALAGEVIEMNAAHYTAWWLRRRCLETLVAEAEAEAGGQGKGGREGEVEEAVEALYDEELAYARQVAEENPKNYQVR